MGTLKLNDLKGKAKLASKNGMLLTNDGYLHYKETGEIKPSELKSNNLSKDKKAWFGGYAAGITEVQVRYAKKGLFSRLKNAFSKKKKYDSPDIRLEDWQEESINNVLKQFNNINNK